MNKINKEWKKLFAEIDYRGYKQNTGTKMVFKEGFGIVYEQD